MGGCSASPKLKADAAQGGWNEMRWGKKIKKKIFIYLKRSRCPRGQGGGGRPGDDLFLIEVILQLAADVAFGGWSREEKKNLPLLAWPRFQGSPGGLITKRETHEASRGNPTLPGNPLHRPVLPPAPGPVAKSCSISPAGHVARELRIIFLLPPQAFQGPFSFLLCPQSLQTRGFPLLVPLAPLPRGAAVSF